MNPTKSILFNSIEPLLHVCLTQADRHGLDEIRISTARAREIHREIVIARKALETATAKSRSKENFFSHLDAIHNS
jgi:hypothetical protein